MFDYILQHICCNVNYLFGFSSFTKSSLYFRVRFFLDGLHEIFVNTAVNDGTDIAALMSCFLKKDINSEIFPILSNEVRRLKETEGGVQSMCDVMKKYEEIAVKEAHVCGTYNPDPKDDPERIYKRSYTGFGFYRGRVCPG